MCEVPVFYVTTDRETRLIADRIVEGLRRHRLDGRPVAIISEQASHIDWSHVCASAMVGIVDAGRHSPETVAFARANRAELSARPSVFLPIVAPQREDFADGDAAAGERFVSETGWRPSQTVALKPARAPVRARHVGWRPRHPVVIAESGPTAPDSVERCVDELAYAVWSSAVSAA